MARARIVAGLTLALGVAAGSCIDPSDYDDCADKAAKRGALIEGCTVVGDPQGAKCPATDSPLVIGTLFNDACYDLHEVVCGPDERVMGEDSVECCYVAKIRSRACD